MVLHITANRSRTKPDELYLTFRLPLMFSIGSSRSEEMDTHFLAEAYK